MKLTNHLYLRNQLIKLHRAALPAIKPANPKPPDLDPVVDYYSENRWFSRSHDTKIDTKCIKRLGKKEKESKYFHNIKLSHLAKGHHYYFADIRYGDDHNISSRSDKTEYVVVDVQAPNHAPKGYVDGANGTSFYGWADDVDTNSPLHVRIYDGDVMIADMYANEYRSDLGKDRGFSYTVPESLKDGKQHSIHIFAINEPQGPNPLLTYGNFSFACGNNGAMPVTRFYNTKHNAHFYSINPLGQTMVPQKHRGWENHGYTFNAFPDTYDNTVSVYACWTGSTHVYGTDPALMGYPKPCQETPYRMFDAFPDNGPDRKPVYLMHNASTDSFVLSNGLSDAYYLESTQGFVFTDETPLFYAPVGLMVEDIGIYPIGEFPEEQLDASHSEEERIDFNQAAFLLLQ